MKTTMYLKASHKLFCPGPVNVAENVRQVVATLEIGHREKEFSTLFKSVNSKLLDVFEIREQSKYQSVIITGSGSASNEAVLSSVVGQKNILVLSNGEFGQRLGDISRIHNPNTFQIRLEWGIPFNLSQIRKFVKENNIEMISMVHHETSTGMLNPILKVGKIVHDFGLIFHVDAVSSAGSDKIDIEQAHIDFLTTSSSKALGSIPGLSIVIGKVKSFESIKDIPPRTAYLNLYKFYRYAKDLKQTPNTPAVQLFGALEQALCNILVNKIENVRADLRKKAVLIRKTLKQMDIHPLLDSKHQMSSMLTTFSLPDYLLASDLKNALKSLGFVIYEGKGPLKDKVFQIAHIGEITFEQIQEFKVAFETVINQYRTPVNQMVNNQSKHPSRFKDNSSMYN